MKVFALLSASAAVLCAGITWYIQAPAPTAVLASPTAPLASQRTHSPNAHPADGLSDAAGPERAALPSAPAPENSELTGSRQGSIFSHSATQYPASKRHLQTSVAASSRGSSIEANLAASPLQLAPSAVQGSDFSPQNEFLVPLGARLPAAMLAAPEDEEMGSTQGEVADAIAEAFLSEVPPLEAAKPWQTGRRRPSAAEMDIWNESLEIANARYRAIYGESAYLARTLAAAKEALLEK